MLTPLSWAEAAEGDRAAMSETATQHNRQSRASARRGWRSAGAGVWVRQSDMERSSQWRQGLREAKGCWGRGVTRAADPSFNTLDGAGRFKGGEGAAAERERAAAGTAGRTAEVCQGKLGRACVSPVAMARHG